jgi:hypothetical protein
MKTSLQKLTLLVILFFGIYSLAISQDMLGIISSNYSGVNAIHINPASMANSKLCMDINVMTVNPTFQNNYLYFNQEDYNASALFKKSCFVNSERSSTNPENVEEDVCVISDNYDKKNKYLWNSCLMQLPSVMLTYNRHAFAFNVAARTAFSMRNIAYHAAKFGFDGSHFKPQQGIDYAFENADITQMAWTELTLSYAYVFKKEALSQWAIGFSGKYLLGYSAIYAEGYDNQYKMIDDETLQVHNLDAEYGHSLPSNPMGGSYEYMDKMFTGHGASMNIGITYQKNMNVSNDVHSKGFGCNSHESYLYKIGLSLLDFGYIHFKDNAHTFEFDNVSTYWYDFDKVDVKDIEHFDKTMSAQFFGDSLASAADDNFTITMPTSLSLQFDYQFRPNYYINTTIIQNVKVGEHQLHRPSVVAVTPRYESSWFEVAVPLSLQNYQRASMGLSVRLFGVTIGTDRLGGILGLNDVYGLDFYCSVKLSFVNGTCNKKCQTSKMALLNFKNKNNKRSYKAKKSRRAFASR